MSVSAAWLNAWSDDLFSTCKTRRSVNQSIDHTIYDHVADLGKSEIDGINIAKKGFTFPFWRISTVSSHSSDIFGGGKSDGRKIWEVVDEDRDDKLTWFPVAVS